MQKINDLIVETNELKNDTTRLNEMNLHLQTTLKNATARLNNNSTQLLAAIDDLQNQTKFLINTTYNLEDQENHLKIVASSSETTFRNLADLSENFSGKLENLEETVDMLLNKTKYLENSTSLLREGISINVFFRQLSSTFYWCK